MKKRIISLFLLLSFLLLLTSCKNYKYEYEDSSYTKGPGVINTTIENISVDWVSGKVKFRFEDRTDIEVREKSSIEIKDQNTLRYKVEGTSLYVKCAKSGKLNLTELDKNLTIALPKDYLLKNVNITTVSADVDTDRLTLENITITTTSGDVSVDADAKSILVESVSGDIKVKQKNQADSIVMKTTSGNITTNLDTVNKVEGKTSSGAIELDGENLIQATADSISGIITIKSETCPTQLTISTTSGKVTVFVPQDSSFTATLRGTMSNLSSDFAYTKSDKQYKIGSGTNDFKITTTTGDVFLKYYPVKE